MTERRINLSDSGLLTNASGFEAQKLEDTHL